jgi:thiol:disulfide interchange protein DsbA
MMLKRLTSLVAALALSAVVTHAQAATAGKDYKPVSPPQPTEAAGKVEVLEFFQYGCGHCYDFEPTVKAWKAKKPKDVEWRYVPTVWDESRVPQAKLYYAMDALGLVEQYHEKLYAAVHDKQLKIWDKEVLSKWAAQQPGLDVKKLIEAYDSFGVANQVQRAAKLTKDYRISGTPSVVVNGKYLTGPSFTVTEQGGVDYAKFTAILDELVAGERKGPK